MPRGSTSFFTIFLDLLFFKFCVCECLPECVCMCHIHAIFMHACGGQKRAVELLVLELEAVVSHPVNSGN